MRFNLSVSFYEAEDNDVGSEREDGSWSGVFGQVLEKNADIGVGQIVFTPSRLGSVCHISLSLTRIKCYCTTTFVKIN